MALLRQSNMEFMLRQSATVPGDDSDALTISCVCTTLKARWRTDPVQWDASVLDSLNHLQYYRSAEWKPATAANASDFSAVAYYFGKMLRDSLNVPVGLICNAIGGSPTEGHG